MSSNRYTVPEDEGYEPGSNDSVLKNLLGIKGCEDIEQLEAEELVRTGLDLVEVYDDHHQFLVEASVMKSWQRLWVSCM